MVSHPARLKRGHGNGERVELGEERLLYELRERRITCLCRSDPGIAMD